MMRFGFCRGRPRGRGTRTSATVASARLTSLGGGSSSGPPIGRPLPSTSTDPLRPLATLGFADCRAPFFAGAKLPSRKVSSHLSRPRLSSVPSSVRHAFSQTPCSCHRCNRRQQVDGEGNSSGRNRHAAPVCRTQSMPSKQARFGAGGRPRLSRRRFGWGSKGQSTSTANQPTASAASS